MANDLKMAIVESILQDLGQMAGRRLRKARVPEGSREGGIQRDCGHQRACFPDGPEG